MTICPNCNKNPAEPRGLARFDDWCSPCRRERYRYYNARQTEKLSWDIDPHRKTAELYSAFRHKKSRIQKTDRLIKLLKITEIPADQAELILKLYQDQADL